MFKAVQKHRFVLGVQKCTAFFLLLHLSFVDISVPLAGLEWSTVSAAQVTIDASASGQQNEHNKSGSQSVFIDDQTGYKFYVDSNGTCVYQKTTDGGDSWDGAVVFDSDSACSSPVIWYDQWTPGDSGSFIHITSIDAAGTGENMQYNRLDTTDDSLLVTAANAVNISTTTVPSGLTLASGANKNTITKATDGVLYAAVNDGGGSHVVSCSSSCQTETNWTEVGTTPMDNQNADWALLLPQADGDIMLIVRDTSNAAHDLEYQTWNGSAWSGTWSTIDGNVPENTAYDVAYSATLDPDTFDIYMAYISDADTLGGADDDIRTAIYDASAGSWSSGADIITDDATRAITAVAIALDENTKNVYVAYSARTTAGTANSGEVYWATSTNAMSSWGNEQGPINTSAGNAYGVDLNFTSDERIYATWYFDNGADLFGDTIADISPATVASSSGSQIAEVRASTTDFYIGGTFIISENVATRTITDMTITEQGTVAADTSIDNIDIYYDIDSSAPYDCVSESYGGAESTFGSTDLNGFTGANGTAGFSDIVEISPSKTFCGYVVLDILKDTVDGTTLDVVIEDPLTDIVVTGGVTPIPPEVINITGSTTIRDSDLTLTHYRWLNDDGDEGLASAIEAEDTPAAGFANGTTRRLRLQVDAAGSTTSLPTTFQLDYATKTASCAAVTEWIDVGDSGGVWDMSASVITEGANSTNIGTGSGGLTDPSGPPTYLTPNGALRDTSSQTGSLTVDFDEFLEFEFAIEPTVTAPQGNTYCFRLSDQGETLGAYDVYAEGSITADIEVSASSTQVASLEVGESNAYVGGTFVIERPGTARTLTSIMITEVGSVDATNLTSPTLYVDYDTVAPYDCTGESFSLSDQSISGSAFTGANGTSTFATSTTLSSTRSLCGYVVFDVSSDALNGETIEIEITDPTTDVVVTGSSVGPSTPVSPAGSTTLAGPVITQVHYHWRNDDGNETGATSATGGVENTPLTDFALSTPIRLRVGLSNEGATTSVEHRYGLEYGIKLTTCENVSVWTDVGATADAWDMFDSASLTNGETTTDIGTSTGGVSDENTSFIGSNAGVRDTDSFSASTTITETEYVDFEYSIQSTASTSYETTYCFRLIEDDTPLLAYDNYAELTMAPKRDFKVQRGTEVITGTSVTLTAGVDYTAPSASTSAFVRITGSHHTGAGRSTSNNQNSNIYSAYIVDPSNLTTSFTIERISTNNDTRVSWEILEFVGDPGTDNEMIVRAQETVSLSATTLIATGSVASGVGDDNDVVVFITGQRSNAANRTEAYSHQHTSEWSSTSSVPVVQRIAHGGNVTDVSYAVVEFTGLNWKVQRVEHSYDAIGVVETEPVTAVNSINRTFLHTQKRHATTTVVADFGHEVWLSSIGFVSFELDTLASSTIEHVSVAWVIENTQTSNGAMVVQHDDGSSQGGSEPLLIQVPLDTPVNAANNASIFIRSSVSHAGNNMPRPLLDATISASTTYDLWRSDTGGSGPVSFRAEIVQWPVTGLAVRQNYYRFYVDNDALDPSDPWPVGVNDVGENTPITALEEPVAEGETIRIRMTLQVSNATLPAGLSSFGLQYGKRDTSCSAIETWTDVGNVSSSSAWRAFDAPGVTDDAALSTDPPGAGDLNISVADVAGRYVEVGPVSGNPFAVNEDEDIEYDWHVTHNGADGSSVYCFRMVNSDGTPLDGYLNYPQLRTAGFTPVGTDWRWYGDEENETPTSPLAIENATPVDISNGEGVALRQLVDEIKIVDGSNMKFKVQYSEYADFSVVTDVVATSSCQATSTWCYVDGGGVNNALIDSTLLTNADSCVSQVGDGCGTHNASGGAVAGDTHPGGASREYSFTLQNAGARVNTVYYFRLYDVTNDTPVVASSTYPSVVTEGGSLTFDLTGVATGTVTEGVTTDIATTPTSIPFGVATFDTEIEAAYRLTVDTNATEGYQMYVYSNQNLLDSYGNEIEPVTGTNASPSAWSTGCPGVSVGCFGYHAGDDSLSGGSTRFAPDDTYAAFSTTTLEEVMFSNQPATSESTDLILKLQVSNQQPAGLYENNLIFISVPIF